LRSRGTRYGRKIVGGIFAKVIFDQHRTGPFGDGGDREEWIDTDGSGNNGTVGYIQCVISGFSLRTGEDLPLMIDDAVVRVLSHHATSKRVHANQIVVGDASP